MSNSDFREEINAIVVLDELAERVQAGHRAVQLAESNALDSALSAGTALIAIQRRIAGSMKDWMAKNLPGIPVSTWKLYQQLARNRDKIEAIRKGNPRLSISEARRLLVKRKKPHADTEEEESTPELTDTQLIAALTIKGIDWFVENMPRGWLGALEDRIGGQVLSRVKHEYPRVRAKNLPRLVWSADQSTKH